MSTASWSEAMGIPMPACKMQGCCCRGASPSTPAKKLLEKAANGDDFSRNFFSIFLPYKTHEEARQVVPGLVERTLKAAQKSPDFKDEADVVFYHCRYITPDNKCGIWEDRPQLCRAYPDSPFVVFAPNCAFEPWSKAVKEKMAAMQAELKNLKSLKADLEKVRSGEDIEKMEALLQMDSPLNLLSLVLLLTPTYLASPIFSCLY